MQYQTALRNSFTGNSYPILLKELKRKSLIYCTMEKLIIMYIFLT